MRNSIKLALNQMPGLLNSTRLFCEGLGPSCASKVVKMELEGVLNVPFNSLHPPHLMQVSIVFFRELHNFLHFKMSLSRLVQHLRCKKCIFPFCAIMKPFTVSSSLLKNTHFQLTFILKCLIKQQFCGPYNFMQT